MNKINKKIYFGCSMRGGYDALSKEELTQIPSIIEELGYVLASKHLTGDWQKTEAPLNPTEIHDRDYQWLTESDAGIFEISNPSLGVGSEISDMIHLGKPVLCIYKKNLEQKVSAYIRGKNKSKFVSNNFTIRAYTNQADLKNAIEEFSF